MPNNNIRVMIVKPGEPAQKALIPNRLEAFQLGVGGFIEVIPMPGMPGCWIVCDEEGKLKNYDFNRRVGGHALVGIFIVTAQEGEDFRSLTEEECKRVEQLLK